MVKWFANKIQELDIQIENIQLQLNKRCGEIPYVENIQEIFRIGETTLSEILAEIGDISRFDDVKKCKSSED